MRNFLPAVFFFCLLAADAGAQKKKTFKINPGEKVIEKIPREDMYTYPEFKAATAYFRNGSFSVAKMNYNALYSEMQFIEKGDTVSLSNENTIKYISIEADTFYYSDGYLRQLAYEGDVKLAKRTSLVFMNRQRLSGFGEASGTGIETYNAVANKSYLKELVAQEIITIGKNEYFYVGDRFNNFKELTKKSLLEMYAENEKEVLDYMKENKVSLTNEEDIKKLLKHFKDN